MKHVLNLAVAILFLFSSGFLSLLAQSFPIEVPVVVVKYFPVKEEQIDIEQTGDWGESLEHTRRKCDSLTQSLVAFLADASRFRVYKYPDSRPSLQYRVVKTFEFLEPLPTRKSLLRKKPLTDYRRIVERINGQYWVEEQGVKEIWVWGYHGGVLDLWESNMAGPFGDVSNSNRDPNDLPIYRRTYVLFHYNYQRGLSEAVENHMHQIEAMLNYVDGRDDTPPEKWNQLLFWGRFVGSDASHKIVNPGCGWAHYPPNARRDYDWANKIYVETDIEDWKPDGSGEKKRINCERWNCTSLGWFKFWMQSLPGMNNGLSYQGKPLTNWWIFIGDWDEAMAKGLKLTGE